MEPDFFHILGKASTCFEIGITTTGRTGGKVYGCFLCLWRRGGYSFAQHPLNPPPCSTGRYFVPSPKWLPFSRWDCDYCSRQKNQISRESKRVRHRRSCEKNSHQQRGRGLRQQGEKNYSRSLQTDLFLI